jgi:hypothetical protein
LIFLCAIVLVRRNMASTSGSPFTTPVNEKDRALIY